MRTFHLLLAGGLVLVPTLSGAQSAPLRLSEALAEADRAAYANRQANAERDIGRARARQPLKGVLPSARVESGIIRTTDPIGVFGTLLRQRQVTPAAFDPARLNSPAPISNVQGGVVFELPLLNADALTGWRAARTAAEASAAAAEWTTRDVRHAIVRGYYGAVLAQQKVAALVAAERAAQSAVRQTELMVRQGLVTRADALQATVRAADLAAQLLGARHDALTARQQLALLLGRSSQAVHEAEFVLPETLPDDSTVRAQALRDEPRQELSRDDVRAARLGLRAARLDARRATATLLPRLNGFARYDWNAPTTLFAGRPNWTVGVMASWALFGGADEWAEISEATARARSAQAGEQALSAQAQLEVDQSERLVRVAAEKLTLMALASKQSSEALRLIEKRYAGGLATMTELLGAHAASTSGALQHIAARYDLIVAIAAQRLAIGADPGELVVLDNAAPHSTFARE